MMDERAVLHRYKSTSHAGVACALMVMGWFTYQYYWQDVFRKDLMIIGAATAVIKVATLIWYRWRD